MPWRRADEKSNDDSSTGLRDGETVAGAAGDTLESSGFVNYRRSSARLEQWAGRGGQCVHDRKAGSASELDDRCTPDEAVDLGGGREPPWWRPRQQ